MIWALEPRPWRQMIWGRRVVGGGFEEGERDERGLLGLEMPFIVAPILDMVVIDRSFQGREGGSGWMMGVMLIYD